MSLNYKSVHAFFVTQVCAASGSFTWALIHYFETKNWSLDAYFLGMISGLVMVTLHRHGAKRSNPSNADYTKRSFHHPEHGHLLRRARSLRLQAGTSDQVHQTRGTNAM
jgi:hypothetical protein